MNLLAVGDWGSGRPAQRLVAGAMGEYAAAARPALDGVLLAGDNFYVRAGADVWRTLFEEMYGPSLAIPFYAVLGNHDYKYDNDRTELDYARDHPQSRFKLPARWYRLELPEREPLVTLIFVDSNYRDMPAARWTRQGDWLKAELGKPRRTKWLVVCGHHPLYSNGEHGDDARLKREWGDLFEKSGVDFYVCGHDHDLQHLRLPGHATDFVLCGGGGAGTRPMKRAEGDRGPFARRLHGFVHLRFGRGAVDVNYVAVDEASPSGRTVHSFSESPRHGASHQQPPPSPGIPGVGGGEGFP